MTARKILTAFREHGINLRAEGEQFLVRPRDGMLPTPLRDALIANRAEVLQLLRSPGVPCTGCGGPLFPCPTVCFWCRRRTAARAA